jgi:hypothetical protein
VWTERLDESRCTTACLYRLHHHHHSSCLTIQCSIRPLTEKSYILIAFMSQHDTFQTCIEMITKCYGKNLHKSGIIFL